MKRALWLVVAVAEAALIVLAVSHDRSFLLAPHQRRPSVVEEAKRQVKFDEVGEIGRRLATILNERFPVGSPEDTLRTKLVGEGFAMPPNLTGCERAAEALQTESAHMQCLGVVNHLVYESTAGTCDDRVHVYWSADHGKITNVMTAYSVGCVQDQ
jgi:hypothetical protein